MQQSDNKTGLEKSFQLRRQKKTSESIKYIQPIVLWSVIVNQPTMMRPLDLEIVNGLGKVSIVGRADRALKIRRPMFPLPWRTAWISDSISPGWLSVGRPLPAATGLDRARETATHVSESR